MKVKVRNQWYESKDETIVIEVDTPEREAICSLIGGRRKHCFYPLDSKLTNKEIEKIMEID